MLPVGQLEAGTARPSLLQLAAGVVTAPPARILDRLDMQPCSGRWGLLQVSIAMDIINVGLGPKHGPDTAQEQHVCARMWGNTTSLVSGSLM